MGAAAPLPRLPPPPPPPPPPVYYGPREFGHELAVKDILRARLYHKQMLATYKGEMDWDFHRHMEDVEHNINGHCRYINEKFGDKSRHYLPEEQ